MLGGQGLFSPSTLPIQLYFWFQLSLLQRKARPGIQKYVNEAHRKQATKRGKAGIAAMFVMIQMYLLFAPETTEKRTTVQLFRQSARSVTWYGLP